MLTNNANSRIACVESVSVSVNEWAVCWMKGTLLVFWVAIICRGGLSGTFETMRN